MLQRDSSDTCELSEKSNHGGLIVRYSCIHQSAPAVQLPWMLNFNSTTHHQCCQHMPAERKMMSTDKLTLLKMIIESGSSRVNNSRFNLDFLWVTSVAKTYKTTFFNVGIALLVDTNRVFSLRRCIPEVQALISITIGC